MVDLKSLHDKAVQSLPFSHSPYSLKRVASSVLLDNGKVYTGVNIENASYGGTVCAERVAIWKALSENKNAKIKEVVVVVEGPEAWPPCGFCRQVMAEFGHPQDTKIHLGTTAKIEKSFSLEELLPHSFDVSNLKK